MKKEFRMKKYIEVGVWVFVFSLFASYSYGIQEGYQYIPIAISNGEESFYTPFFLVAKANIINKKIEELDTVVVDKSHHQIFLSYVDALKANDKSALKDIIHSNLSSDQIFEDKLYSYLIENAQTYLKGMVYVKQTIQIGRDMYYQCIDEKEQTQTLVIGNINKQPKLRLYLTEHCDQMIIQMNKFGAKTLNSIPSIPQDGYTLHIPLDEEGNFPAYLYFQPIPLDVNLKTGNSSSSLEPKIGSLIDTLHTLFDFSYPTWDYSYFINHLDIRSKDFILTYIDDNKDGIPNNNHKVTLDVITYS